MQKEIQLTDKTLLVVGLEENITRVYINEDCLYLDIKYGLNNELISLPSIDFELLGIYPELTEEQAKSVVESYYGGTKFHNYIGDMMLDTAKESFQSLMERENITGYDKYAILYKEK